MNVSAIMLLGTGIRLANQIEEIAADGRMNYLSDVLLIKRPHVLVSFFEAYCTLI